MNQWSVCGPKDLPHVVREILKLSADNKIWLLNGSMGAGKTTFVKALAGVLGISEAVSSPTFAIVQEYEAANQEPVYHFDFYRLNDPQEALDIGCDEYFYSGYLCLIEWPSKIEELLPEKHIRINIALGSGSTDRLITMTIH